MAATLYKLRLEFSIAPFVLLWPADRPARFHVANVYLSDRRAAGKPTVRACKREHFPPTVSRARVNATVALYRAARSGCANATDERIPRARRWIRADRRVKKYYSRARPLLWPRINCELITPERRTASGSRRIIRGLISNRRVINRGSRLSEAPLTGDTQ